MAKELRKIRLTEPDKVWLREVYEKYLRGEQSDVRTLTVELSGRVPRDFDPMEIDSRLLRNGCQITLLGIAFFDANNEAVIKANKVIGEIKKILRRFPTTQRISAQDIELETNLQEDEIAQILEQLPFAGGLFHHAGFSTGISGGLSAILLEDEVFNNYMRYDSLEQALESIMDNSETHTSDNEQNLDMTQDTKPAVFIASSVSSLPIANAIQQLLDYDADVTVWNQGVFKLSHSSIDSLVRQLSRSDFGIFILSPEDIGEIKGEKLLTARDNVIFELGLFIGRLGKERSFLVTPRDAPDLHLPTDLSGIQPATFNPSRSDRVAALGSACNEIRSVIQELGPIVKKNTRTLSHP